MAPLTAYHRTPLPPTGVSHAVACRLERCDRSTPSHLITARANTLSVYAITDNSLAHLRTHRLHGTVTSLSVVQTLQTKQDGRDRILVSFELAKMTLLEWQHDASEFDLVPVSLHTFEKLPQVAEERSTLIAHDPASRMTVLHLPTNSGGDGTLAVLPWFTEELDLEGLGMDRQGWEQGGSQIPYAPSHLIPLTSLQPSLAPSASVATRSSTLSSTSSANSTANAFLPNAPPPIRNIQALTFLPGFTEPTLALLYAPDLTWAGRLEHLAHNHLVSLVTLSTRSTSAATDSNDTSNTSSSSPTMAILISTSPPLPYSLLPQIQSIPPHLGIGSVLLMSANGLLLLDIQGGKLVGTDTNDWFRRDFPPGRTLPSGIGGTADTAIDAETLEGSVVHFLADPNDETSNSITTTSSSSSDNKALVFCKSGKLWQLVIERIGRSISGIKLELLDRDVHDPERVALRGGVSCTVRIGNDMLFVGSETSHSRLVAIENAGRFGSQALAAIKAKAPQVDKVELEPEDEEMDFDDEDIYGDSTKSVVEKKPIKKQESVLNLSRSQGILDNTGNASGKESNLKLRILDELEGYGSIRSLVMGLVDEEGSSAELVGATGAGENAGLTIFHRTVPTKNRRTQPLPTSTNAGYDSNEGLAGIFAQDGIWSVRLGPRVDQPVNTSDRLTIASNEEGTFLYQTVTGGQFELVKFEQDFRTLHATSLGSGDETVVVLVGSAEIRVFDRELNSVQSIQNTPVIPNEVSARVTATRSHIALHVGSRSSVESRLYRFDSSTRTLNEVEEVRGKGRIAVWTDTERRGHLIRPDQVEPRVAKYGSNGRPVINMSQDDQEKVDDDDDDDLYGTSEKNVPQAVAMEIENEHRGIEKELEQVRQEEKQVRNEDVENPERDWLVRLDEEGTLTIHLLPTLVEVFRSQAVSILPSVVSDSPDSTPAPIPESIDVDDLAIDRIQLVTIGESDPVADEKLHLLVWTANGTMVLYEAFAAEVPPVSRSTSNDSPLPLPRLALRFVKTLVHHVPVSTPRRKGSNLPVPARKEIVPFSAVSGYAGAFVTGEEPVWIVKGKHGPARLFEAGEKGVYGFSLSVDGDFAIMTREGLQLATLPATVSFNHDLPLSFVPKDRTYAYLTFDLDSGMYVAATLNETRFVAFDDEGVPVFKETAPRLLEPTNYQSTLELLVPGSWNAIDGYEFRQNEFVCTVKNVSLHSKSHASGQRDFIAVGTTVYRGEDLAAKGGVYIFEVVKIVADPSAPGQDHILKLRFFEDTKSIVGNICDLNGYLFLSMGQKLYARAFEQDEVLIAVGFLDLGVHVTSLTAMKNFLLIGDAMQSVALVAFQEDPYKLVFLGRDYRPSRISSANFLVNEGRVSFVTGDDRGVIRLFEYDPSNIASHAGQRLLCRTEYHAGSESIATMLFAKHAPNEDPKQNGILFGGIDGSLFTLVPVRDAVFRRLQSLQATMSRHVLSFGGLNPRGYRIVKNDTVSRAISKGILDGDLLARFEYLPVDLQTDLAANCGTDVDTVLANMRTLRVYE
ncbi:cleavage/polyadenylation factor CFT1 [Sporobolomyces koalae]|uniref:cleavage/polyadenylation factor CFT1 n=1 Tax=Sporobolomyces koalae TaxID=500713 RepID=UPI00316FAE39